MKSYAKKRLLLIYGVMLAGLILASFLHSILLLTVFNLVYIVLFSPYFKLNKYMEEQQKRSWLYKVAKALMIFFAAGLYICILMAKPSFNEVWFLLSFLAGLTSFFIFLWVKIDEVDESLLEKAFGNCVGARRYRSGKSEIEVSKDD